VGGRVVVAERQGVGLAELDDGAIHDALAASDDVAAAALAADEDVAVALRSAARIDGALASCDVIGGTAPDRVAAALAAARARLDGEAAAD
jgi:hypothetical protein